MKMFKITLYCIDFDEIGVKDIITLIESNKYISVSRSQYKAADIGEWDDDHPLNDKRTPIKEFEKYF